MTRKPTLAEAFANELVAMPGFRGASIRRADLFAAYVEAGESKTEADRAAFAYARRSDEPEAPNARALLVNMLNGGRSAAFVAGWGWR